MDRRIGTLFLVGILLLSITTVTLMGPSSGIVSAAYDGTTRDGLEYSYTSNGTAVEIVGYVGPGGAITIPESISGLPVTGIGYEAFYNQSDVSSVYLPDNLTFIDGSAFADCTSLGSIAIPDNVTYIGAQSFLDCTSLKKVTIGSGVDDFGLFAFGYCSSLSSVTIANGTTDIGMYAFYDCSDLTSISIPGSVSAIGIYAFSFCSNLTSISIPGPLTALGDDMFYGCTSLSSIVVPVDVTYIGNSTFYGCSLLATVIFDGNAPSVGIGWAQGCGDDLMIYYHQGASGFSTPSWNGETSTTLGTVPTSPNGPTATIDAGIIYLSWSAPSYTGGSAIGHYILYQDGKAIRTLNSTGTNITDLTYGQTYSFTVVAVNANGTGAPSAPLLVTFGTANSRANGEGLDLLILIALFCAVIMGAIVLFRFRKKKGGSRINKDGPTVTTAPDSNINTDGEKITGTKKKKELDGPGILDRTMVVARNSETPI